MSAITTIIITLNEERNIERCIASVAEVSDEIIVVDSYSEDRTTDIAQKMGAKVLKRDWGGYAETKNWANQQATHDYILSMDADEALSPELRNSIKHVKELGLSGVYSFNRLTNYCGHWVRHCGWYPDVKERLFPKAIAKWEGAYVHEVMTFSGNPKRVHLQGDLHHFTIYTREEHIERVERYTDLDAERMRDAGKKGGNLRGVLSAAVRFVRMYIFKLGFLDGVAGWHICRISAWAAWLKYKKLNALGRG